MGLGAGGYLMKYCAMMKKRAYEAAHDWPKLAAQARLRVMEQGQGI
jgi:hypothetical protein